MLAVKENQPILHEKMKRLLDEATLEGFKELRHDMIQTVDGDHGRIETRQVWMTDQIESLPSGILDGWPALASLAVVESKRDVNGQTSSERRYFISSVSKVDAKAMGGYIRGGTGASKTGCTGNWTWVLGKMTAASAKTTVPKTSQGCVGWR